MRKSPLILIIEDTFTSPFLAVICQRIFCGIKWQLVATEILFLKDIPFATTRDCSFSAKKGKKEFLKGMCLLTIRISKVVLNCFQNLKS